MQDHYCALNKSSFSAHLSCCGLDELRTSKVDVPELVYNAINSSEWAVGEFEREREGAVKKIIV